MNVNVENELVETVDEVKYLSEEYVIECSEHEPEVWKRMKRLSVRMKCLAMKVLSGRMLYGKLKNEQKLGLSRSYTKGKTTRNKPSRSSKVSKVPTRVQLRSLLNVINFVK